VSFDKKKEALNKADAKLIRYLAENNHWSPFSHPKAQFRLTLPIFVARQWEKHRVGCVRGYDIYDQNEVSRRYVDSEPEFYMPTRWRSRPDGSVKQGSGDYVHPQTAKFCDQEYAAAIEGCEKAYNQLLRGGIAPEQARIVLPQSMMTSWIETGSLAYWARLVKQRTDPHAQQEVQELAAQISAAMAEYFPVSWAALMA
jgi:thymidylate synthase, flavin-dependent